LQAQTIISNYDTNDSVAKLGIGIFYYLRNGMRERFVRIRSNQMKTTKAKLAVLILFLASSAGALAATQIKIATLAPQGTQWATDFTVGADEIKARTDGRVTLKFYWGGAQGAETKVLQKMKIGQLHGGTFSPTDFQNQFPDLNIYGLPFVFESEDEVDYVRQQMDATLIQEFDDLGYVTFGFASGGFAVVLSNDPVRSHDDLKGKKVWLPEGDLISFEAMKALQLTPYPSSLTNVLTGLQTGLIDIVMIPPAVAVALQWHTKVKYVTEVPVLYVMGFMAIQKKTFGRIDSADQAIVREVMTKVYADVNARSRDEYVNGIEALLSVGLERVEPDAAEFQKIRDVTLETNRKMAQDGMFSMDRLQQMQSHIDDFRQEKTGGNSGAQ
jgi:TRAP-type C4-dicarboxylate transport system substrate-binding protein